MYLRLRLIGAGLDGDPFRVDCPNVTYVLVDHENMQAICQIHPRQQPPQIPAPGSPLYPYLGDKYVLIGLEPAALNAWYARLHAQFPNRTPPYAPELV